MKAHAPTIVLGLFLLAGTVIGFASFFPALNLAGPANRSMAQVVGVMAGVAPNVFNTTAEQLHQKELSLDARQQALDAETAMNARQTNTAMYLAVWLGFVTVLVIANFALDIWRKRASDAHAA